MIWYFGAWYMNHFCILAGKQLAYSEAGFDGRMVGVNKAANISKIVCLWRPCARTEHGTGTNEIIEDYSSTYLGWLQHTTFVNSTLWAPRARSR